MGRAAVHGAAPGLVHAAQLRAHGAGGPGDGLASQRSDCPAPSTRRLAPASSACATGMDSPCGSIFLRSRTAVMDSVRHAAVGGPAAGGKTMKGQEARKARSCGTAWPGPGRQGRIGHSPAGARTVGSTPRCRKSPGDGAWRRAPKHSAGRLAGRGEGPGGTSCVTRGARHETKRTKTTGCGGPQALRDGSARYRLARDNCCYREPARQFRRSRRATRKPPCLVPAILGPSETQFNRLDRRRFHPAEARAPRHPHPARVETLPAPDGDFGSR